MKTQIIVLPSEVNELAEKVSANKQIEVQNVLQQIFTGTDDWEKQVDAIEVKDINDKMSIQLAEVARKNSKEARLSAEKIFDAKREEVQNLKAEFDLEDKLWLKAKQVMQIKFKAIEEKAAWKANFVKRFEAEQKELRTQKRINEVSQYAEINRIEFEAMSDESFNSFLSGLKSTHEAKIEAERLAEEARIAEIEAEKKRQAERDAENERLKKEAAEREKQIEAERKANEKKLAEAKAEADRVEAEREKQLEAERAKAAKAAAEKQAEIDRVKKDLEAKELAEEKERQRIIAEQEAKDAALKAAQLAPDKEKINALFIAIRDFNFPECETKEAAQIIADVKNEFDAVLENIKNKAKALK